MNERGVKDFQLLWRLLQLPLAFCKVMGWLARPSVHDQMTVNTTTLAFYCTEYVRMRVWSRQVHFYSLPWLFLLVCPCHCHPVSEALC